MAFVPSQGLLNAEGQIFTSNYAAYKNHLPEFNVAARYYKQAIDAYWSLKNTIADFKFGIKQFTFDGRKSQMIQLDNGVDIVLGRYEPEKRFNRFIRVFGREVEQNRKAEAPRSLREQRWLDARKRDAKRAAFAHISIKVFKQILF